AVWEIGTPVENCLQQLRVHVTQAVNAGAEVLVVSHLGASAGTDAPMPSLLLAAAAHEHLLKLGVRTHVSLVVEAGDAVEPLDIIRLIEAGAQAVVPYHGEVAAGSTQAATYFRNL